MKFTIDTRPKPKRKSVFVNAHKLAIATGYHKSHISRVIRRKTRPSISCALLMAQAMDLSLDDFIEKVKNNHIRIRNK